MNAHDIVEQLYHQLQDFEAQGVEPPAAIGLTRSELNAVCEAEGLPIPDEPIGPMTIWGHPVVLVKSPTER